MVICGRRTHARLAIEERLAMRVPEMRHALTRRVVLGFSIGAAAAVASGGRLFAAGAEERADLAAVFGEHGVVGTFALYDPAADRLTLVNPARAQTRLVPASTFKIANTIIALETGVVKDENEVIPYGGKPQPFKQWEK